MVWKYVQFEIEATYLYDDEVGITFGNIGSEFNPFTY